MKVRFLGGGEEVGRLGILVENDGARALFDYGMTATAPPALPMEAPPIDAVAQAFHDSVVNCVPGKNKHCLFRKV